MTLTVANILTVSRLFLAPIFLVFALSDDATGVTVAAIIFAVAAVTDWLDGFSARAYGQVTEQGEFLDPLADKVLTTSAFVAFYMLDIMPLWMILVIIVRDFGITVMRSIADQRGTPMKTSWHAKVKTFLQMLVIVYVIGLLWWSLNAPHDEQYPQLAHDILYSDWTYIPLLVLTLLTMWTAIEYVWTNRSLFQRES